MHFGMVLVPPGYADAVMFAGAGSPYGATVVSGNPPAGPVEAELAVGRFQGKRVAEMAKKLIS
jgi:NAD(P)H dehydrogenase (quinone)